jgi:hypothetical protein
MCIGGGPRFSSVDWAGGYGLSLKSNSHRSIFQRALQIGKSSRRVLFRFPETVQAGTEAGEGDLWRGTHSSETRHDHLFINFSAVGRGCLNLGGDEDGRGDAESLC